MIVQRLRAAGCVFAEDEASLLEGQARGPEELEGLLQRRIAGEPLEHVLGWAEFCGLRIAVDPGVFVPRRRTELLVREAVAVARPGAVVVDLCCGSGAVGAAMAARSAIELYAADIDPTAVACARRNVARAFEGDLYAALPHALRGRIDVLVVNAPYVPTDAIATMPPEARLHEPAVALDGGSDGLDLHRLIAAGAAAWLARDAHIVIETSREQAPTTAAALAAGGFEPTVIHDPAVDGTVVVGRVVADL